MATVDELVSRGREMLLKFDTDGYEQAVPLLREAIETEPHSARAYSALSETYSYWGFRREIGGLEAQSLYDMAYDCAEIALRLEPQGAHAHRAMAIALRRGDRADPGRRKREVEAALKLDDADAETWCELWRVEGYEPESEALRRALELDPDLCELHIDLGAAWCELGRYDEAIAELAQALRINPRNALAYYDLAMTLDRKGEASKAREVLRKARMLHPDDPLIESGLELLENGDG